MQDLIKNFRINDLLIKIMIALSSIFLVASITIHFLSLSGIIINQDGLQFPYIIIHIFIFVLAFPFVLSIQGKKMSIIKMLFSHDLILIKILLVIIYIYSLLFMLSYVFARPSLLNALSFLLQKGSENIQISILSLFSSVWMSVYIYLLSALLCELKNRRET